MPRRANLSHIDDPVSVGARIRAARARRHLSQRDLAFDGCTASYLSRVEAGERAPSVQVLRQLARRLGVTEDFLAFGVERPEEADPFLDAELALRLDDLEQADALLTELRDNAITPRERGRALGGLGQLAFRRGDIAGAIAQLREAVELIESEGGSDPGAVDTLGRAYAMAGEYESAIAVFERSLRAAEARHDDLETMRFSVLLANALIDSASFARAEEVLGHILSVVGDCHDPIVRARLLWSQSRLYALQNDSTTAARYARQALETLEATEHSYYAARAHQLLAHVELDRGNATEALTLLERGLPLISQSGTDFEQAIFRLDRARALLQLGQREEAASVAMGTLDVLGGSSPFDAGRSYSLIAEVFAELGDHARAIELYELALEKLERLPTRYLVEAYLRLADLLEQEGRPQEALALLKRAMQVQIEVGRPLTGR